MKKLIYSDTEFTEKTKAEIEEGRKCAQELLDCWNSLGLPPFKSMFQLIHDPAAVYQMAGGGDLLPNILYVNARSARNSSETIGHPDLLNIEKDKVVINQTEADRLVNANNIYCESESGAEFATACIEYVRLSNLINDKLMSLPSDRMPAVPFSVTGRFMPIVSRIKLESEYLQEIIKLM